MAAGWQLYRLSPGMWTLVVVTWLVLTSLVNSIPYLGPVATAIALPAFMVSFMSMCEELKHGRALRPSLLFDGFRRRPGPLLLLGTLNVLFISAVLLVFWLFDSGAFMQSMNAAAQAARPSQEDVVTIYKGVFLILFLSTPVFAAFWFAPYLTAWDGMSPVKSMFYSFFACLRNWRAFSVYSIAVFALVMAVGLVLSVFSVMLRIPPQAVGFKLAAALVTLPTLLASFYVAYRDIFPEAPAAAPAPESDVRA